ncbi:MAG: carbon monoxide dehydrogenase subunit G [Lautropia sp.]
MEITGVQQIPAPRETVWQALNDPAVLKDCLPGCESVEQSEPDLFKVVMTSSIGPLRARFNGTLKLGDIDAPNRCTMLFEGQGGPIGFGKGRSEVRLIETAGVTELSYTAQAQVGGKLAQVGGRLIDSVARKMSDDFFAAFRRRLESANVAPASGHAAAASGDAAAAGVPQPESPEAAVAMSTGGMPASGTPASGHRDAESNRTAPPAASTGAAAGWSARTWVWIGIALIVGFCLGRLF